MEKSRRRFLRFAGIAAAAAVTQPARAQDYPSRPIRLVIPFPPGGAFDAVGRPFVERLKPLGTVVIENIGGGGSSLGAAAVARARPDGYTLLLGGTQTHVNEALLKARPLYDANKDLDPLAGVAAYPLCIAVHSSVPAKSLTELISYAKANPGKLSYGHSGVGSIQHLTGELFKSLTGTADVIQVPYRGTGPVITDLVGGQIPIGVLGLTSQVIQLHKTGQIRVLATTGATRLAAAPDLPTAAEQGFHDMVVKGSIGLMAPAGTPPAIIEQVAQATRAAVSDASFVQLLGEAGIETMPDSNPEKFRGPRVRRDPVEADRAEDRSQGGLNEPDCPPALRGWNRNRLKPLRISGAETRRRAAASESRCGSNQFADLTLVLHEFYLPAARTKRMAYRKGGAGGGPDRWR